MLISYNKKFIYYHLYKVAGTSIRSALRPYCGKKQIMLQNYNYAAGIIGLPKVKRPLYEFHPRLIDVKRFLGNEIYDSFYKFSFVRDPLDWQKSLYFFTLKNARHHQHNLVRNKTFEEYMRWRIDNDFKLQSDYLFENDVCLVDKIGKFENLSNDMSDICRTIGVSVNLKHKNVAGLGKDVTLSSDLLAEFKEMASPDYRRLGYG